MTLAFPGPHEFGAGFDAAGQNKPMVWLGYRGLHQLIEQPLRCTGKAAISLLLDPLRDVSPKQIRTECLGRFGPEQLMVSLAQLNFRHRWEPIQLGLDRWIGCRP
jgi:hypothetical protein